MKTLYHLPFLLISFLISTHTEAQNSNLLFSKTDSLESDSKDFLKNKFKRVDNGYVLKKWNKNTNLSEFGVTFFSKERKYFFYYLTNQKAKNKKALRKINMDQNLIYDIKTADFNLDSLTSQSIQDPFLNLNSFLQEGPVSIDTLSKIIFLTKSNPLFDQSKKMQVDLFYLHYGRGQKTPQRLNFNVDGYSTLHPAVDLKKGRLYFSSDRPGGEGGMDIYYVLLSEIWKKNPNVVKLSNTINTQNDESFPFVDYQGNLFYSSNFGSGDFEIYMAQVENENQWNSFLLPHPINSEGDDFSFFLDYQIGIGSISSDRENIKFNDDIYFFKFAPKLEGLFDSYSFVKGDSLISENSILENDLDLMYKRDPLTRILPLSVKLRIPPVYGKLFLSKNGRFKYFNQSSYEIKKDSFSYSIQSDYGNSEHVWVYLESLPAQLSEDELYDLRPIFYDFDKQNLKKQFIERLDQIVLLLNNNSDLSLTIISSTDCLGSENYNLKLAQGRTNTILKYLTEKITNPDRISGISVGESNVPNNSSLNYSISLKTFEFENKAKDYQEILKKEGILTQILKITNDFHVVFKNYEFLNEAKKGLYNSKIKSIKSKKIITCECYQKSEDYHQSFRKTIFRIN